MRYKTFQKLWVVVALCAVAGPAQTVTAEENLNCLFSDEAIFHEECRDVRAAFQDLRTNSRNMPPQKRREKLDQLVEALEQIKDYSSIASLLVLISKSAYQHHKYSVAENRALEVLKYKDKSDNGVWRQAWAVLSGVYRAHQKIDHAEKAMQKALQGMRCEKEVGGCAFVFQEKGFLELSKKKYDVANTYFDKAANMYMQT